MLPEEPQDEGRLVRGLKALSDPTRLRMVALLSRRARYGEELAEILNLSPATVSHHLRRLDDAGLVTRWRQSPYVLYALRGQGLSAVAAGLADPGKTLWRSLHLPEDDQREERLLRELLDDAGRLPQVPSRRRLRALALRWAAVQFEAGRIYSQRELNRILLTITDDPLVLRGELLRDGWIFREGGAYRRASLPGAEGSET